MMLENAIVRYILWESDMLRGDYPFLTLDDKDYACEVARNNDCVSCIERVVWDNEEDYQDGEPADFFEVIWRR